MTEPKATRPAPPPLEHPLPPCPLCSEDTDYDDGFYCAPCGASWDAKLSHLDGYSSWDDPALTQCPATVQPWKGSTRFPWAADAVYRCLRSDSHDGEHYGLDDRGRDHQWYATNVDGYMTEHAERVAP